MRDRRVLLSTRDVDGLPVEVAHVTDPTGPNVPAVRLHVGRTSALFEIGTAALSDLAAVLAAVQAHPNGSEGAADRLSPWADEPWRLHRLDRDEDTIEGVALHLPDALVQTDNVMTHEGERVRIVWASHYSRTLFVRPEAA